MFGVVKMSSERLHPLLCSLVATVLGGKSLAFTSVWFIRYLKPNPAYSCHRRRLVTYTLGGVFLFINKNN